MGISGGVDNYRTNFGEVLYPINELTFAISLSKVQPITSRARVFFTCSLNFTEGLMPIYILFPAPK